MPEIEDRNIAVWIVIMIVGWLLYSFVCGAQLGAYVGINIAAPLAVEFANSEAGKSAAAELSADQIEALTEAGLERMRMVDWWFWWPLFNSIAWASAAAFLGFMRVVKFNEGLVALAYIPALVQTSEEWQPPDSFLVESVTIVLALAIVHLVSRLMSALRGGDTTVSPG